MTVRPVWLAVPPHRFSTLWSVGKVQVRVQDGRAVGAAEAPQGEVVYLVEVRGGQLSRCKPRSASLHNLHLFPPVFTGDILTDFPFIEASFGCSVAGVVS